MKHQPAAGNIVGVTYFKVSSIRVEVSRDAIGQFPEVPILPENTGAVPLWCRARTNDCTVKVNGLGNTVVIPLALGERAKLCDLAVLPDKAAIHCFPGRDRTSDN